MLGILLGLGSAVAFGANSTITRRCMFRVSSNYVAMVSVTAGSLFFILVTGITGELFGIHQLHWRVYLLWALAGIINFALGRTWAYRSIQLLGATRSNMVTSLNPIVTIILAIALLHESVTPIQLLGILFSLSGPLLILIKEDTSRGASQMKSGSYGKEVDRRTLLLGLLYGAGGAVFWGSSAIVIKFALQAGGAPVSGTLISYVAACAIISASFLFKTENRQEILQGGAALRIASFSGLTTGVAQLLRYISLQYGSAIVISIVLRTVSIWVLLFAFLFNRKYESFSGWVLLGNGLLIVGTILMIFP